MGDDDQQSWTLDEVQAILRKKGITMLVGGCGCCGSPWIKFAYAGATLEMDEASFDMFKKDGGKG